MSKWPDEFPKRLRDVCWNLNDGELVGIMPYWNRHCDYSSRGSELFLKNVMQNYFTKNQISTETVEPLINFIIQTFTIFYNQDEQIFKVSIKKQKDCEKREINKNKFKKCAEEMGFSTSQMSSMLKLVLKHCTEFYGSILSK